MTTVLSCIVGLQILIVILLLVRRASAETDPKLLKRVVEMEQRATGSSIQLLGELTSRLEQSGGQTREKLVSGFGEVRSSLETALAAGRAEQQTTLSRSTNQLESRFDTLEGKLQSKIGELAVQTNQNLEQMRSVVDQKLLAIGEQVQQKLDQNIKEGFAQFEKVQHHLKAAEEQLRQVGVLGESINDLNSLLKLPHLRGGFGEASLERLLSDYLPASMYEMQYNLGAGLGRVDAIIRFPDGRVLPIDAKFPREQILPLFDNADSAFLKEARESLGKVLKELAKKIGDYIQPPATTEMALMYLPSETIFFEAIRNREAIEYLNHHRVYPVSPNTLLVTLRAISMVYEWYKFREGIEKTAEELARAQKNFGYFETKFEALGKSLEKAQEAYATASGHLSRYKLKISNVTGVEPAQLEMGEITEQAEAAAGGDT